MSARFSCSAKTKLGYDFYFAELPITNLTATPWTSAEHVLHYLLDHRSACYALYQQIPNNHPRQWEAVHLSHPLLKLPLYVYDKDSDEDVCTRICNYLELDI